MPRFLRPFLSMGQLARSTYVTSGWMTLRVALQTVWVALIARALGPEGYGFLAGITALAATLGTMTGVGFGVLLLQDASREIETFSGAWKRALAMAATSGAFLCFVYALFAPRVFATQGENGNFVAVSITELLCFPIIAIASYAFQAHERMGWAGALQSLIPAGNLVAFGLFAWWSPTHTLAAYLPFHAIMAVLSALGSIAIVQSILSPGPARYTPTPRDIREGAGFSVMRLADTALVTLDKSLTLRMADSHSAGIYSAAYRLISVATLPLVSLSMSALPRLFRANGQDKTMVQLVRKLLMVTVAYGAFAGIAAWFIAGALPILLGDRFRPTVEVARWLTLSPLLQGLYIIGANLLVTQKMVGLRVAAQLLTLGVMMLTAVTLIPNFGLAGAAGMLLITQAVGAVLIWFCYALGRHRDSRVASPPNR